MIELLGAAAVAVIPVVPAAEEMLLVAAAIGCVIDDSSAFGAANIPLNPGVVEGAAAATFKPGAIELVEVEDSFVVARDLRLKAGPAGLAASVDCVVPNDGKLMACLLVGAEGVVVAPPGTPEGWGWEAPDPKVAGDGKSEVVEPVRFGAFADTRGNFETAGADVVLASALFSAFDFAVKLLKSEPAG